MGGAKKMKQVLQLGFIVLLLTGCSGRLSHISESVYGEQGIIKDHHYDYKKSHDVSELKIPKNLSSTHPDDYYQVPPISHGQLAKKTEGAISILPPGSNLTKKKSYQQQKKAIQENATEQPSELVNYARSDQYKLLLTYAQPRAQAWLDVQQALHNSGYKILDTQEDKHAMFVLHAPDQLGNVMTAHMKRYQIRVLDGGKISFIVVIAEGKQSPNYLVSKGILRDIRKQLLKPSSI